MINIYLSGSIKKGASDPRGEEAFWAPEHEREICNAVNGRVRLLNPAKSPIRRNEYFVNYGCDIFLIQKSDVVLVDLRTEKGIGVGAELMYAQFIGKTVIGWIPENSCYKRDKVEDVFGEDLVNWIHPFAFGLCDEISDTLEGACAHINRMYEAGGFVKDVNKAPERALEAFQREYGTDFLERFSHD